MEESEDCCVGVDVYFDVEVYFDFDVDIDQKTEKTKEENIWKREIFGLRRRRRME